MRFCLLLAALAAMFVPAAWSDIRGCECEVGKPSTASIRGCSLCLEAEKRPESEEYFLLRDVNPTKPNRWLALPRKAFDGVSPLSKMTAGDRLALWNLAINKAKEMWGDGWAVAMNGDISRTQCHLHVHVGKLLEDQELRVAGVFVDGPGDLPAPEDGTGLWFHPVGKRLHVHAGEQITETVLLR